MRACNGGSGYLSLVHQSSEEGSAPFTRALATLLTGTVLAQAIPFLAAPWIARLFEPAQFAVFGSVMAIFNVLNVMVTGRYELALMNPPARVDAAHLLRGGLLFTSAAVVVVTFILLLVGRSLLIRTGDADPGTTGFFVLALTFCGGVQMLFQQWLLRERVFKAMAQVKVVQAVGITGLTVAFGMLGQARGLEWAYLGGWSLFAVVTAFAVHRSAPLPGRWQPTRSFALLRKYKEYPLHTVWPALLNSAASGAAVIYMGLFFDQGTAGHHNFARQYLLVPISMFGVALGQVLYERTASAVRAGRSIARDLRRVIMALLGAALVACLVISLFGSSLFALVFGETWREAGRAAEVLVWGYGAQLIAGPLSVQLLALGRIKATMVFPVLFAALLALMPLFDHLPAMSFMALLSGVEVVAYGAYAALVWYHVRRYERGLPYAAT